LTSSRYPGGKSGSGVYQRIISQMPPHERYIEPFLGGGAVMRRKRPASESWGVDVDARVVASARRLYRRCEWLVPRPGGLAVPFDLGGFTFERADGIGFLRRFHCRPDTLVYCDPPYPMSTRSSPRRMYRYELSDDRHQELLSELLRLPALVMVSGYSCELYDQALSSWRVLRYRTMTRGGLMADECLWCNFPEPVELHDYRYLGRDYRERERIRRKEARWVRRLSEMTVLERRAVESALLTVRSQAPSA
jgi:DNA adenine methylase